MLRLLLLLLAHLLFGTADAKPPSWRKDWEKKIKPQILSGYLCHRATVPPTIDGKIDDSLWTNTAWSADFVDIEGDAKPSPRFRTRVKMSWDDDFLYVAADLVDPHVWGTITQHDAVIFYDPDLEIFIDPNGDSHDYFEFEINALNSYWDLFLPKPYKNGGKADSTWEIQGLKSAIHVSGTLNDPSDRDIGWTVEVAFPWQAFSTPKKPAAPPQENEQWRVNFSRVHWPTKVEAGRYVKVPKVSEDNWVWSPQGVVDMHRPERWGLVQFTKKTKEEAAFIPDSSMLVRDALHDVYYAQKTFKLAKQRWAARWEELGLSPSKRPDLGLPQLKSTPDGFSCSIQWTPPGSSPQYWEIDQDALVKSHIKGD